MYTDIKDSKVVITGITGGIAFSTAELALNLGAKVIVTARTQEKLNQAIEKLSGKVDGFVLDVTDPDAVESFFDQVGAFDHLITPAATSTFGMIADLDIASTKELIDSKQWGQIYCVKAASKHLSKSGSITLFSGTVTQKVLPGATAFAAAGAAIEASARIWAAELAPVRVNTIVPGIIGTPIWQGLMGEEGAKEHLENIAQALPVGRVGHAKDIAKTAVYLMDNGFVTGASIVVDGGHRLI